MKPDDITYLTDAPTLWKEALDSAASLDSLTHVLHTWRELCPDAWDARPTTTTEFDDWRHGLAKERKGRSNAEAWMDRYGAVIIPAKLMEVSIVAEQYKVPWGLAYIRLAEAAKP